MIEAKVIEHSVSPGGVELVTLQLKYPRFILPEFNTHRVFSRNASSSRAIPVQKMLDQVRTEPAMPLHWGKNQPGMQADEQLQDMEVSHAKQLWKEAANYASFVAEKMMAMGLHKQVVNRLLEPFLHISAVVSSTEWSNFFALRDHKDAQPEIQALAREMRWAMDNSTPKALVPGDLHLPYVTEDERRTLDGRHDLLCQVSAARCARVSYLKHDGTTPSIEEDVELFNRLAGGVPIHASPLEHQATPSADPGEWSGNFRGWYQYRKVYEGCHNSLTNP